MLGWTEHGIGKSYLKSPDNPTIGTLPQNWMALFLCRYHSESNWYLLAEDPPSDMANCNQGLNIISTFGNGFGRQKNNLSC